VKLRHSLIALVIVSNLAHAQTTNMDVGAGANSTNAGASSIANPTATGIGNTQSINFGSSGSGAGDVTYHGDYTVKNVPSVNAPNLTSGLDTCMGSTSGSFNIAGLGFGGGTTFVDDNCKRLKLARELWNFGMKAGAIAMLCNDDEVRQALADTGFACPARRKKENE
jgi:hypothetical protein